MKKQDKEAFVEEFRERVRRAPAFYLTDFTGLDVKSMTVLRSRLRESGAEYVVVKNRLARLALEDLDLPDLSEQLTGPTGFVLGYEGPVGAAKAVSDFAEENEDRPVFKAGILEKKLLDNAQIARLAKLPTREQLLAELAGALEAPLQAVAYVLGAKLQEMTGLLDQLARQKEEEG